MALIRTRAAGKSLRAAQRNRAGLGGRAASQKGIERELETEILDETDDLPGDVGRPRDTNQGRRGGAHRAGKHEVIDPALAEERGGIADLRVSGQPDAKRKRPQRSARGRR